MEANRISGNEGCAVYLREAGYVVEHFRLTPNETTIIYRSRPFEHKEEAENHEHDYRRGGRRHVCPVCLDAACEVKSLKCGR